LVGGSNPPSAIKKLGKEGGFLGFGGKKVSDKEKAARERVAAALV